LALSQIAGALHRLQKRRLTKHLVIGTFDRTEAAMRLLTEHAIDFLLDLDPYLQGYLCFVPSANQFKVRAKLVTGKDDT